MKQVDEITVNELKEMAEKMYGNLVKAVVDIEKQLLVVDAEMHADQEQYLLENGSSQQDLWGINLHPDEFGTDSFIAYDSMINLRPSQNNMSRGVADEGVRKRIVEIVQQKVRPE